jgi:hypothetical protein
MAAEHVTTHGFICTETSEADDEAEGIRMF